MSLGNINLNFHLQCFQAWSLHGIQSFFFHTEQTYSRICFSRSIRAWLDLAKDLLFLCHVDSHFLSGQTNVLICYFSNSNRSKHVNECVLQAISLDNTRVVPGLGSFTNAFIQIWGERRGMGWLRVLNLQFFIFSLFQFLSTVIPIFFL